jgi:hypothetical protein
VYWPLRAIGPAAAEAVPTLRRALERDRENSFYVFTLWMMHDPLFTSLQHVVNGIRIESFRWWQFHQWWNTHH